MKTQPQKVDQATAMKLKNFIARVENLESEKREIQEEISSIWKEAKNFGLDDQAMRKLVQKRRDPEKAENIEMMIDLYEGVLDT